MMMMVGVMMMMMMMIVIMMMMVAMVMMMMVMAKTSYVYKTCEAEVCCVILLEASRYYFSRVYDWKVGLVSVLRAKFLMSSRDDSVDIRTSSGTAPAERKSLAFSSAKQKRKKMQTLVSV
jgi:hypothetical protein